MKPLNISSCFMAAAAAASLLIVTPVLATPYTPVVPGVTPAGGAALPPPSVVPGKEWSEGGISGTGPDRNDLGVAEAQQNVAWDGSGGIVDGNDYKLPGGSPWFGDDVDALAHGLDALYPEVVTDSSNLLFSTGNGTTMLGSGAFLNSEGFIIGSAGDISYETPGGPAKGVWAVGSVDIDDMFFPVDVDGLEIWGPEPTGFDSDKFSLFGDAAPISAPVGSPGVSIWDLGSMSPYLSQTTVFDAVTSLLGTGDAFEEEYDLDALMVFDADVDSEFGQLGDSLIFSIRQLTDASPSGFYATGSEIFKLDVDGLGTIFNPTGGPSISASYLMHGGHAWDKPYALAAMKDPMGVQLDLNALEAASIPEPSRAMLLLLGGVAALLRRRVR